MLQHIITEVDIFDQYFLGISLDDLGRKEDAINDFTKAIEINPQDASAYYNRGRYILSIFPRNFFK